MTELPNIVNHVSRAAQQSGFERERYVDSKVPQDINKIVVILFMGDLRSTSIMSSLLFRIYSETVLQGKYVIMCSYPGYSGLFPSADEYWSVSDALMVSDFINNSQGFSNKDKRALSLGIQLRRHFYIVLTEEDFKPFYDKGLTSAYFDRMNKIQRFLPSIPAWRSDLVTALAKRGGKYIFLAATNVGRFWNPLENCEKTLYFKKDFWIKLTERLLAENYSPVIYQGSGNYDLSQNFGERCFYCNDRNIINVMSAMRATGCVLDVFSGISRLAILARCPFLVMDDRTRYIKSIEYEINDLCVVKGLPYRYMFSFPAVVEHGEYNEIIEHIVRISSTFSAQVAGLELSPSSESYEEVSYDVVRQHKARKLGLRFIKVERLEI
jgi:hypothetical protein